MSRVALIYVNPIEYHGPHLPLTTDYDISRGMWERLRSALESAGTNLQVTSLHEIHRGCDPVRGPGSEPTSLPELKRLILSSARTAMQDHPDLVLFLTFHGAPRHAAAIEAGIQYLEKEGLRAYNPFNHVMRRLRDYEPSWAADIAPLIADPDYRERWLANASTDFHGGLQETSILLALHPDRVNPNWQSTPDCPERWLPIPFKFATRVLRALKLETAAREVALAGDATAWAHHPTFLGYTGKPRLATAEIGEALVEILLRDYVSGFYAVLNGAERSPKPILQWAVRN